MCGCEKHHDQTANCTCLCPEHANFQRAHDLAMSRYDTIRTLEADLAAAVARAEAAEAERDDLRAKVAAVEALADKIEVDIRPFVEPDEETVVHRIRAALDNPGPLLAKVRADELREAAAEVTRAWLLSHPKGIAWMLRDRADQIDGGGE